MLWQVNDVNPVPASPCPSLPSHLPYCPPWVQSFHLLLKAALQSHSWQLSSSHWILNCTWNSVWNASPLISSFLSYKMRVIRGRKELTVCSRGRRGQGISPVQFSNKTVRAKAGCCSPAGPWSFPSPWLHQHRLWAHHHSIWPCCLEQNPQPTSPSI